jgi:chemotaxis signal transduction protein
MTLQNPQTLSASLTSAASADQTLQVLVFKLDDSLVAVPAATVVKVMNRPTDRQANSLGLLYVGQVAIRILPLRSLDLATASPEPFLIVLQIRPGELHGIGVDQPPDLLDLPLAALQPLPPAQPGSDLLKLTSHVARITQGEVISTILVLDLNQIIESPSQSAAR